jgi:hypothetical protein
VRALASGGRILRGRGSRVTHNPVASNISESYDLAMAKVNKFDVEAPVPIPDDEDEQTLAAIDEGIRDAEAGRAVPSEEVRKLLPKWTSSSSSIQDISDLSF